MIPGLWEVYYNQGSSKVGNGVDSNKHLPISPISDAFLRIPASSCDPANMGRISVPLCAFLNTTQLERQNRSMRSPTEADECTARDVRRGT